LPKFKRRIRINEMARVPNYVLVGINEQYRRIILCNAFLREFYVAIVAIVHMKM
jgi:hypothetical protein